MTTTKNPTGEGIAGADPVRRELLDVKQTAQLCNVSPRTVYRLADAGRMPRPLKLGSLCRWRSDELRRWIEDGCPSVRRVAGARGKGVA